MQVKVAMTAVPVLLVFCAIALVSAFAFPDHRHRKLLVGSAGLGVSVAMYASPLVAMVSHLCLPLKFLARNIAANLNGNIETGKKQGNRVVQFYTPKIQVSFRKMKKKTLSCFSIINLSWFVFSNYIHPRW